MPEIANLAADFEQTEASADFVEHSHAADLTDYAALAAFNQNIYAADLDSSDLP